MRRRDDEKVEQFMERFITESMQIQGVPEVMMISSFINRVRQPQLCEKLGEDFPTTFDGLMDKVRAFVRGKDTILRAREWDVKKNPRPYRTREGTDNQAKATQYPAKGRSYADKRRQKIFSKNHNPCVTLPDHTPDEYCEFHRCHGHKTNDCIHLWKEIEEAIKSGKLSHLVKEIGAATSKGKEPTKWEENEKRRSYVNMIRRHPNEEGGDNKRTKTFDEEPPPWLECYITFPPLKYWEA
ncbi:hypothetical protein E3N88_00109 [Mikania micrantha]|uniref:Retrotransposon gag domain-containing protein n=1 Tax=Mikania micrantha TaxID=192012 RepID=A0A5N6PY09_9ASTR|nr:hypothetical protein E3N88_00109 [Mikania micrantha]